MTAITLKRNYQSSSSSESSATWALHRPKCGLPARRSRKVARIASSHRVASIAPALQQHRSRVISFSSSDTEVSSAETELGTALSENEIESVLPMSQEKSPSPSKSRSDGETDAPCKEENEVDDDLGSVRMSSSPSPPPVGWQWPAEKTLEVGSWIDTKGKGKAVEDRDPGEIKRRKITKEAEFKDEDDEADDEMEDAEDMTVTPKQKLPRNKKCLDISIRHARNVAPTPSIQRITEGFHGLTPYSMEMQISPERPSFAQSSHRLSDLFDPDEVDAALLASPVSGPSGKKTAKSRPTSKRRSRIEPARKLLPRPRSAASAARKLEKERRRLYAADPFCDASMTVLLAFDHFPPPVSEEPVPATSSWAYGPLSSPIRLATEPPSSPIRSRISGQRMRTNKTLRRTSPTSLVPSRHHQRGHLVRSRHRTDSRLPLPLIGPTALAGQHVVTFVLEQKEARLKRRHAVSRQNAQIDYTALAGMRARCFESLATVDAFQNTLEDIRKGCWWWAPAEFPSAAPVPLSTAPLLSSPRSSAAIQSSGRTVSSRQLEAVHNVEEVQVDCLVGDIARETEGDAAAVIALVCEAEPAVVLSRPNRRRRESTPSEDLDRTRRAEAAQDRIRDRVVMETSAEAVQVEVVAHQTRAISRTIARREREAEWTLSSDRAAAQRRQLGRQRDHVEVIHPAPHRHISALNPTWLEAVVIPHAPPASIPGEVIEAEDTDVDSESDSESVVSEPPAYDSSTYPRHMTRPAHLIPRRSPSPVQAPARLPSYAVNRYSRRSPSPPPPYNAETDRQTLLAPFFIGEDDDEEEEAGFAMVAVPPVREQRVIGAYPSAAANEHVWGGEERGRNRFEAALEMEEGEDADLIDELTSAYGVNDGRAGQGSVVGAIGGFFGRFFGRR